MSSLPTPSRAPAVYRTRDPIANFRLRVRLRRVTSSSLFLEMARQEVGGESGGDVELKQMRQLETHAVPETRVFGWQEKVFSRREFAKYSDPHSATTGTTSSTETPLDEKYRNLVRQMRERGDSSASNDRLFSYVDVDDALRVEGVGDDPLTTSPTEESSTLRNRKSAKLIAAASAVGGVAGGGGGGGKTNPKREASVWQTMKIVADFTPENDNAAAAASVGDSTLTVNPHEVVLCTLSYNSNGTLVVDPDFNLAKSSRPYLVETGALDSWEVVLENACETMTREEEAREAKILRGLYERHAKDRAATVGTAFDVPPAQSLRVACRGEIVSAWDFEYDHLYVVWCVIPGKWWWGSRIEDAGGGGEEEEAKIDSILTGLTHCCSVGRSGMAMFGECFELDLLYRNLGGGGKIEEDANMASEADKSHLRPNPLKPSQLPFEIREWPQLLIQVMSRDSWYRTRTEGYGAVPLPTQPGAHTVDIACWRPIGGPVDELRRYYVGGSPELNDPFFAAKPPAAEDADDGIGHLNLFGFRSLTTGTVRVRLNLVFQSQALVDLSKKVRLKTGAPSSSVLSIGGHQHQRGKDKMGGMFHLVGIVQAFQQAKNRMVEARESLLKDLKTD